MGVLEDAGALAAAPGAPLAAALPAGAGAAAAAAGGVEDCSALRANFDTMRSAITTNCPNFGHCLHIDFFIFQ